jgi:hypothetical protein
MHQLCRRLKGSKEERGMSCDYRTSTGGRARHGVMAATIGGLFPLDAGWMELRDIHYLASASVHDI